ncbi:NAD(P)-binding protein [Endozoicomonas sp. G2_1]|uniref:NAD(P)-binding protein n=1 Tax=Endozoicomonas sp. G2_1 TaxID=2821091 RepID=UPI001ADBF8FD|nr:NAD(P)-binding protein [Endozoicomonas sp. G2_1]MBO9489060.1 NAD(P)-binding protein [Endozoicomonas sp. G2_1]
MNIEKHVCIVGAGIVGIVAAFLEARKGHKVTLIEAADRAGGLLKSDSCDYGSFDYGTHVASETGIAELDQFLFSGMNELNSYIFTESKSGSFSHGKMNVDSPFLNINHLSDDYLFKANSELIEYRKSDTKKDLKTAIEQRYGSLIYQQAYAPFIEKTFGVSPELLPNYYLFFFDMYRVIAFDSNTTEELKKIDYLNDRLGFHHSSKGVRKYYPKQGGIGFWVDTLISQLADLGVDILLGQQVKTVEQQNNSNWQLGLTDENLEADELIWTVSSALLTKFLAIDSHLTKPEFRTTGLFDFVYDNPLKTNSFYINNFDVNHYATRLTCYQNLNSTDEQNFYAVTVEALVNSDIELNELTDVIEQELAKMGLIDDSHCCQFKQFRPIESGFPVITLEQANEFEALNQKIVNGYSNITLLGRSSNKGFFMNELLANTYRELV